MSTLTGKTIGKYEIHEKLGRGGMAEVYKGYQKNLDRFVALKFMHTFLMAEQDFLHRFEREAKAMAAMNHPNIVGVFDFDVFGENSYYLVMEYISGGTLKDKLEQLVITGERLPLEKVVQIAKEVADALAYAHRRNMVHRDIKPANIMLDEESGRAILTDFGIVKLVGGQSMAYTATGALIGTPSYMSPEQALGKSGDERVDIYSLGVLLFQMVAGQLPYEADTPLAVVMKHVNEPTPMPISFNPDIPIDLQAIILKAMAKAPEERFQSAIEMATALRGVDLSGAELTGDQAPVSLTTMIEQDTSVSERTKSGKTAVAVPTAISAGPAETAVLPKKRSPWPYIAAFAVVALIIVGLIFGLGGNRDRLDATDAAVVDLPPSTSTNVPPTATDMLKETAVSSETPDVVATAVAAIALTETAKPTKTSVPTNTPTPTKMVTPDATADFLASCTQVVDLVLSYAYQSQSTSYAPIGVSFPMNWILKNSGTCPWPTGSHWAYIEGNQLGADEPILLESEVSSDEEINLSANLTAPPTVNTFDSTWQLFSADGESIGSPITFSISTYIPETATPVPTNTPVIVSSPTPEEVVELNYAFSIQNCEYVGSSDWRCRVRLTPYGGGGGPYTMFIFLNPIVELRDNYTYDYYVQARRCSAWNTEIKVIDEATSLEMSRHLYVDPDDYFDGGCTE